MTIKLPNINNKSNITSHRGFIAELFEPGHLSLPNRGPLGSNGLASARHFMVPKAAYEDRKCDNGYQLITKFVNIFLNE